MAPEEVLGLPAGASPDACRAAFRRLVREHHPDAHPGASSAETRRHAEELRRVTAAWAALLAEQRGGRVERRSTDPADPPSEADPETIFDATPFDGEGMDGEVALRSPPSGLVVVPMALFALAVLAFSVSVVMNLTVLWQLAIGLLVLAGVSFVLAPFFVMLRRR